MRGLAQDLRFAVRLLRGSPGFAAAAVVTLALGIGANVAIFSLVDEIWLRPMPVPHPERLVRIFTSNPSSEGVVAQGYSSYPDFLDVRASAKTLSGVAAFQGRGAQLDTGSENKLVSAAVVSDNFFDVLAPVPSRGRVFHERELGRPGARVVMLSDPFWRQQFQSDPAVAGGTVVLDRQQVLVAGILPRGFRGAQPGMVPDVWIPVTTWVELTGERGRLVARGSRDYDLYARLAPGATLPRAEAELEGISARLGRDFAATNSGRRMSAVPESRSRGAAAQTSRMLLALSALVLAIACANVAGLMLARAEHRRQELATRVALGAGRLRLARQLLAETALIAAIATPAALAVGSYLIDWLPGLLPAVGFTSHIDAHMSGRVLLVAALLGLLSLVAFGLLPAWQASGAAPAQALGQQRFDGGTARARVRRALVAGQVALSLVLTVSGGLLVRSLVNAQRADPGFNAHQNLLVLELVPAFGTRGEGADRAFVEEARRRLEALPDVIGTAAAMRIPFGLSGSGATRKAFLPGARGAAQTEGIPIHYDPVGDRFFELVGTRLTAGRAIEARDVATRAKVLVINQTMARRYFAGRDPLGQSVRLSGRQVEEYRVIGVSEDSVNADLTEEAVPYLYTPMQDDDYSELTLLVKTQGDPAAAAPDVRRVLRDTNRDVPIVYLATLTEHMRLATSEQRMTAGLIVSLGALGLFLAAVGLYGLTSFLVRRRTREIGIRLALGAQPRAVFEQVIGQALLLTCVGVVAGAAGAVAAARAMRSFLFDVAPGDVLSFATGVAVVAAVTCAAAFGPAWRATRIDPVKALRSE
jgi:putative ABC transport system permease protein